MRRVSSMDFGSSASFACEIQFINCGLSSREMAGDIVKDAAPSGIQPQQEDCTQIGIFGIWRQVPGQLPRSELDYLEVCSARINAPGFFDGLRIFSLIRVRDPVHQLRVEFAGDGVVSSEPIKQHWNREKDTRPDQQCFERAASKEM